MAKQARVQRLVIGVGVGEMRLVVLSAEADAGGEVKWGGGERRVLAGALSGDGAPAGVMDAALLESGKFTVRLTNEAGLDMRFAAELVA